LRWSFVSHGCSDCHHLLEGRKMTDNNFVLVPVEPTDKMLQAGYWNEETSLHSQADAYRAMIAAAPQAAPMPDEREELDRLRSALALSPEDEAPFPDGFDVAVLPADRYWKLREVEERAALSAAPVSEQPQPASTAHPDSERDVWIAYNSVDDDEPVMFFTELPGQELKERFVLKHYKCRPTALTTAQPADHINDAVEMVRTAKPSANDIARAFNTWAPTPAQPQQLSDELIEKVARSADCLHVNIVGDRAKAIERLRNFARALLAAQGGGK
jgi:hypothetical protein